MFDIFPYKILREKSEMKVKEIDNINLNIITVIETKRKVRRSEDISICFTRHRNMKEPQEKYPF